MRFLILALLLIFLTGCKGIDYSCEFDSDCEIKNVGNYCGYYPLCVNKNYQPHPPELKSNVCGFLSIDYCECVEKKCVGKFNATLE